MGALAAAGVNSFKFFLAYKGALAVTDAQLLKGLARCKELGALPLARPRVRVRVAAGLGQHVPPDSEVAAAAARMPRVSSGCKPVRPRVASRWCKPSARCCMADGRGPALGARSAPSSQHACTRGAGSPDRVQALTGATQVGWMRCAAGDARARPSAAAAAAEALGLPHSDACPNPVGARRAGALRECGRARGRAGARVCQRRDRPGGALPQSARRVRGAPRPRRAAPGRPMRFDWRARAPPEPARRPWHAPLARVEMRQRGAGASQRPGGCRALTPSWGAPPASPTAPSVGLAAHPQSARVTRRTRAAGRGHGARAAAGGVCERAAVRRARHERRRGGRGGARAARRPARGRRGGRVRLRRRRAHGLGHRLPGARPRPAHARGRPAAAAGPPRSAAPGHMHGRAKPAARPVRLDSVGPWWRAGRGPARRCRRARGAAGATRAPGPLTLNPATRRSPRSTS